MLLILLSALCSVSVAVLLKLAPRWRLDMPQLVMWNYLAASGLCWVLLSPPLENLQRPDTPWPVLLGLAVVLPSLFLVLAACVRAAGIVRTDVAQRLSLLLSLLAAFTVFGEQASVIKLAGLALGLVAVAGIVVRPERGSGPVQGQRAWLLLLVVWGGFAFVDVMLKVVAQAGTPSSASLQVAFALAFLLMLFWQLVRHWRGRTELEVRHLGAGLLLGLLNFGNIYFYVRAHQSLPDSPAVVFAAMNIGVVVLGTLVGIAAFGEKTGRWNRLAIVLAVAAIALIALAP
ncbi:EamA/RhaT family transporter [Lysobacter sp. GX 14042]|uniref:EamA family transporter n=1 Tax=Lysobacter sp. GX 14042 TaxID=2907155 RepID=UPI001F2B1234|nr:EamA/RhaT family transporter [Lysobacter sp. GX 14042]MCE7031434.1 EamA/RhaT family transporter [Lysobacter sp. GX 14042]